MTIKLQIEGSAAAQAADNLTMIPGLSVTIEMASTQETEKDPIVAATAIATIIGAAGSITTIVDQILSWRDRWRKSHDGGATAEHDDDQQVDKIVLITEERRLLLTNMSPEDIARALRRVPDSSH
jgi:hypothetical protein